MAKRIIVDENDRVIGAKSRDELDLAQDIYRVSSLWLTNSRGEVLLAQRSFKGRNGPGEWGPAVAGTVEEGETYEQSIYKEASEEIGLSGVVFSKSAKLRFEGQRNFFCQYFAAVVDKTLDEFTPHPDEVEQLQWVKPDELRADVKNKSSRYVPSMARLVELFLGNE